MPNSAPAELSAAAAKLLTPQSMHRGQSSTGRALAGAVASSQQTWQQIEHHPSRKCEGEKQEAESKGLQQR